MNCFLALTFSAVLAHAAVSPPVVEWSWNGQRANVARQTSDGGFIAGGSVHDNYWVMRLSTNGAFLWETKGQRPGDNFEDPVTDVRETSEGGFVALVETDPAIDGFGDEDCQVIRLNSSGAVIWDKTFGTEGQDRPQKIIQTSDGGFAFGASFSAGTNGNRTSTNHGYFDWWFVRLDTNGNKVADLSFGGSGLDIFETFIQTADGGFALVGRSESPVSGNKTAPNYGGADFWVVRLDATGNNLWDRSFGGNGNDDAFSVWETNAVLVVGGNSQSSATGKNQQRCGDMDHWRGWQRQQTVGTCH